MSIQDKRSMFLAIALAAISSMGIATDLEAVHGGHFDTKPAAVEKKDAGKSALAVHKNGPRGKQIDINGASKAALKKLPGVSDADADKIIANRPYGSKMWLITDNVLARDTYDGIKNLIVAKQPYKTAAENAAFYEKMKKEKAAKAKP